MWGSSKDSFATPALSYGSRLAIWPPWGDGRTQHCMLPIAFEREDVNLPFATSRCSKNPSHQKTNNYITTVCQPFASDTSPKGFGMSTLFSSVALKRVFPDKSVQLVWTSRTGKIRPKQQTHSIRWCCILIGLAAMLRHGLIIYGENSGFSQDFLMDCKRNTSIANVP